MDSLDELLLLGAGCGDGLEDDSRRGFLVGGPVPDSPSATWVERECAAAEALVLLLLLLLDEVLFPWASAPLDRLCFCWVLLDGAWSPPAAGSPRVTVADLGLAALVVPVAPCTSPGAGAGTAAAAAAGFVSCSS